MLRIATVGAVGLLLLSGILHGYWSHRWDTWTDSEIQSAVARIESIPRTVEDWEGQREETDPLTHPEEMVGRGVTVRYRNRNYGDVSVYLACGPTDGLVSHNPQACYISNGYAALSPDLRVSPGLPGEQDHQSFWVSNFTKPEAATPTYLRVFWAWSDGSGWQTPGNARRTFRRDPVIYKCYFIRQLTAPEEPVEGDPCLRLMSALLPRINAMLSAKQ